MGICYQGKTLREAVAERSKAFDESGYIYGLEKLELADEDPAKLMKFQMRALAACVNARETAKLISANPVSTIMGELLFMVATPEGDCVTASHGLVGHIQCFPFIINAIAELGFEDDPGIRSGDIFSTNDPYYGATHAPDCFTFIPVFYEGELIAWTVGLNHIVDVGGVTPGNLSPLSPNTFTDGFLYPPLKTGENFKQHRWWELFWKRRTRTEAFNILDDKMRVTGAVMVHNKILEIVEEFGIKYFKKAMREILERERRQLVQKTIMMAVPGTYHHLCFYPIRYKGFVGQMFPASDKDWLLHEPAELHILPDGRFVIDVEGLSSEDEFHANAYESVVRMNTSLTFWPMLGYSRTLNTAMNFIMDWKLPPGCIFNPQNPLAATIMGQGELGKYQVMWHTCLSYAFFARGYLEECFPQDCTGMGYGLAGTLADGFQWAGGNMSLVTCYSSSGLPYRDGEPACVDAANPQSDMGELETYEFLEPTNLNIGRRLVPNYCSHGKFRGGLGIGMAQLICDPGKSLSIAVFSATGETSRAAFGMCGGYPGINDVVCFIHNTNMRELINKGQGYPTDFIEAKRWIQEGKLKAQKVVYYTGSSPNVEVKDGDLFIVASTARGSWGDPIEREYDLIERDVHYGWVTRDVVEKIYGASIDDNGRVSQRESDDLRNKMRERRRERSVDTKEWWKQQRQRVMDKDFHIDVFNMYADILKYQKFQCEFSQTWQLRDDYTLEREY